MRFVNDWPSRWAAAAPDRVAVSEPLRARTRSWRELDAHAAALARFLEREAQVGPGQRIAFLAENRLEHVEALFAAARLRAMLVPLNHKLTAPELARVVVDCEPRAIVTSGALAPRARELALALGEGRPLARTPLVVTLDGVPFDSRSVPCVPYEAAVAGPRDGVPEEAVVDESDPWLVLYTSGSTGRPKGALVTHRQIVWNAVHTTTACDLGPEDTTVTYTPLFYTGGWNVLSTPLWYRGACVHLVPGVDASAIVDLVARERVTTLFGVPTTLAAIRAANEFQSADLSGLRVVLVGGASCPRSLIEAYAARGIALRQGYGLTEVGPNCLGVRPEDALRKCGSIGRPNLHLEVRVTDELGHAVAPGAEGELRLRGPVVFGGYLGDERATREAFDGDGFFRTGDVVRRDSEGQFWLVGRKDDMFKSGGEKVYAGEVEAAIAAHDAVAEVIVLGVPDEKWGHVGRAVVVARPGALLEPEALRAWLATRLAKFKVPKTVLLADALPRTETGKIARAAVRARWGEALEREGVVPCA
jgi:fatty-acyl-CoA synthase